MIRESIDVLVEGESLTMDEAAQVMDEIMEGEATPAQFGAYVTALRLKGETVEEIAGMARVMQQKALQVHVPGVLVDTAGTGGDRSGSFNISTIAAIVAAGAGAKVAKHIIENIKDQNKEGRKGIKKLLNNSSIRYISKEEWIMINEEEIKRSDKNFSRLKFTSNEEVYKFLNKKIKSS